MQILLNAFWLFPSAPAVGTSMPRETDGRARKVQQQGGPSYGDGTSMKNEFLPNNAAGLGVRGLSSDAHRTIMRKRQASHTSADYPCENGGGTYTCEHGSGWSDIDLQFAGLRPLRPEAAAMFFNQPAL